MKKSALFLTMLLLCGLLLCSCGSNETIPAGEVRLTFDHVKEVVPEDESASAGAIVVKDKKYSYHDTDLIIMHVANTTEKNYSITIFATYYDADGNEIKCEEQSFKEFASGFEKYFMFRPGVEFDRFEYTVEAEKFNGACRCNGFSAEFVGLVKGHFPDMRSSYGKPVPTYLGVATECNKSDVSLDIGIRYLVIFNGKGELETISSHGTTFNWEPDDSSTESKNFPVYQGTKDEIKAWLEELGSDYFGIIIISDVARSKVG